MPALPFIGFSFFLGCLSGVCNHAAWPLWLMPVMSTGLLPLLIERLPRCRASQKFRLRWVFAVAVMGAFFLAGMQSVISSRYVSGRGHFSQYYGAGSYMLLRLLDLPEQRQRSFRMQVQVIALVNISGAEENNRTRIIPARGKLMLYLEKEDRAASLAYGEVILVPARWQAVVTAANPAQFDFSRFLALQYVYHSQYFSAVSWESSNIVRGKPLKARALQWRSKTLDAFSMAGITDSEYALLSALLLGVREHLDPETRLAFAAAGAMHVLCVSGLHVGIICFMLQACLGFLKRIRKLAWLAPCLTIAFIWIYAAMSGFSPSVLRASVMFSMLVAGKLSHRYIPPGNNLAASALVLLLIDPMKAAQVGFQLSYLAVAGIGFLFPLFYSRMQFRHWTADKIWSLICVSMAAQLATGPIGIFYFNRFPPWFLVTNLIAVPLAGLILYMALFFLLMHFTGFGIIAIWASWVTNKLLELLGSFTSWVAGFPAPGFDTLFFSLPELLMLYCFLLGLCCCFLLRKPRFIWFFLAAALLLLSLQSVRHIVRRDKFRITIYDAGRESLKGLHGQKSLLLASPSLLLDTARISMISSRHLMSIASPPEDILSYEAFSSGQLQVWKTQAFARIGPYFWIGGNRVILLDASLGNVLWRFNNQGNDFWQTAALIIVSRGVWPGIMPEMIVHIKAKVVLDASLSQAQREAWIQFCRLHELKYWDVSAQGAFQHVMTSRNYDSIKLTRKGTSMVSTRP